MILSSDPKNRLTIIDAAATIISYYEEKQVSLRNAMKILPEFFDNITPDIYSLIHALVFETVRYQNVLNRVIHIHFQRFLSNKISLNLRNLLRVVTYCLTISSDFKSPHFQEEIQEFTLSSIQDSKLLSLLENYFENLKNWNFDSFLLTIEDPEERISVEYSHPTWLVRDWISYYGLETTLKLLKSNNIIQPVYLRLNLLNYEKVEIIDKLREEEVEIEQDSHLFDVVKVTSWKIPIPRLSSFAKGYYYMQNKGSALVSHILDPQKGETVLDACAAPGGKTFHIAALQEDSGRIIAIDNHFRRLSELVTKVKLFMLNSISPLLYDLRLRLNLQLKFDKILVDAPCSGSGTFASRPDAKWRVDRHQTKWLSNLQYSLLSNISIKLKNSPSASLVYATCSLHPIENESVIQRFLRDHPEFYLQKQKIFIGTPSPEFPLAQRLFPHLNQTEGFSIFKLGKYYD
ncbi:MAG: RsmB/NOP family class I SAM-dependent RNA methyltransferase [Candidatus Heimdallarchaeota archaeon]|nr:MAG: RsmB/NOP family class I SAM-dependent RNA methyltransferase [Candidatus Heimdallarchaeota archaeon]